MSDTHDLDAIAGGAGRDGMEVIDCDVHPVLRNGLPTVYPYMPKAWSERFIRPALDLLEEIHRTGDIFFPRNWTEAVLSGHRSKEAAGAVRRFLAERPDYPVRLRRVILQAADDLFRASSIGP